jgi:vacuolar protein sorting-associated protein 54
MMTDVTVIAQRLGPIAEAGKNIATLQTLVKDKSMPRKNVGQAMAGLLKRSGSKKEVDQEESVTETAVEKDDGDEDQDGESLGILTSDQATDQETQNKADEAARDKESSKSALVSEEQPVEQIKESIPATSTTDQAPSTPPKDMVTETKKLEPAEEDEVTVTETLAAPQNEKELPVEPVSPMDQENAPPNSIEAESIEEPGGEPPTLPTKDDESTKSAVGQSGGEGVQDAEKTPEVPAKTD